MDLGLTGKVAMVGGASRGLGLAVARALVAEGAQVSIASRDAVRIDAAAAALRDGTPGRRCWPCRPTCGPADDITTWHEATMERFGGVDLLFVNTGGPPPGPVLSFDDQAWQQAVDLLLLSAIRMVRLAVPVMAARGGGSILMTTSSAIKEPIANLALSNVVRASVSALVKTLSNELAPQRIRVNNLVPGPHRHRSGARARRGPRQGRQHQPRRAADPDGSDDSRSAATAPPTSSARRRRSCCRTPRPTRPVRSSRSTAACIKGVW